MAKQVPLEEGYMIIPENPDQPARLLGSYSKAANKHYFPIRKLCPITSEPVETVELSPEGVLYSWSFIMMPKMGSREKVAGYGVGQIDLPEGVRIQAPIDGKMGDWKIGMKMKLVPNPVVTEEDGTQYCGFKFVPVQEK